MTRRQRAGVEAAIAPVTVAGLALIRCGCSQAAWAIEIALRSSFHYGLRRADSSSNFSLRGSVNTGIRSENPDDSSYSSRHIAVHASNFPGQPLLILDTLGFADFANVHPRPKTARDAKDVAVR